MATFTRSDDLQGALFVDEDLRGAEFVPHCQIWPPCTRLLAAKQALSAWPPHGTTV